MESVLTILLSTFVGFGVAMVASTLIIEYHNYKRRTMAPVQEGEGGGTLVQTPAELIPGTQPAGAQQQDHVVVQMEAQTNPLHGPAT